MNDTQAKIGKLAEAADQRDAIHVAVAPVVAGQRLSPGDHVGLAADGRAVHPAGALGPVGVVDPFLNVRLYEGDRFWLFLYPLTVTDMRHHWQHPAFNPQVPTGPTKEESRAWIDTFATRLRTRDMGVDATTHKITGDELIEIARRHLERGDWTYDNSESYKEVWDEFPSFWRHYENLTGETVEDKTSVPFTCGC